MMDLSQLPVGIKAEVTSLEHETSPFARQLQRLGFDVGLSVEVLHVGFPSRDPMAVRVGNHTVAIGKAEASTIKIAENPA